MNLHKFISYGHEIWLDVTKITVVREWVKPPKCEVHLDGADCVLIDMPLKEFIEYIYQVRQR